MFYMVRRAFSSLRHEGVRSIVAVFLIIVISLLLIASIPSVFVLLRDELLREPKWLIDGNKIRAILDLVLWVLIAIELMDSIRIYIEKHVLHLESVLSLAMIAVARKIITLNIGAYESLTVWAVGFILVSIGVTYYLVRRSHRLYGVKGIHELDEEAH